MENSTTKRGDLKFSPLTETVSPFNWLWIGTWSMGGHKWGRVDGKESLKTLQYAFNSGIRFFDTAGFYGKGESERLIKKALGEHRKKVFISSKTGLKWDGNSVIHDARPETIIKDMEDSLKRLNTDYIDLFQLHWPDPKVPLSESLDVLRHLKDKGLIRYWGAGNLTASQLYNEVRPYSYMPHQIKFNPLCKENEKVLGLGKENGVSINCVVSPLEQGLLGTGSGRYGLRKLTKKDHRHRNPAFRDAAKVIRAERIHELCKKKGCSTVTAVFLWILSNPYTDIIVAGPKIREQLKETLEHSRILRNLGINKIHVADIFKKRCMDLLVSRAGYEVKEEMDKEI